MGAGVVTKKNTGASEDAIHLAVADLLRLNFPQDAVERHGVCWTTLEIRNARNAIEGA